MKLSKMDKYSIFENWPDHWPSKEHYVSSHSITRSQYEELSDLVDSKASETKIEKFLKSNSEVLSLALYLFSTGHHAAWVYPKQHLRPTSGEIGGMIPDYVLAGANSDGVTWYILELKSSSSSPFVSKGKRVYLSAEGNKGICQLMGYIDVSSRTQSYLRDELKLKGYREPKGVLLIGNGEESENSQVREFKGAWNRMNPRLQIISYSRFLSIIRSKIEFSKG